MKILLGFFQFRVEFSNLILNFKKSEYYLKKIEIKKELILQSSFVIRNVGFQLMWSIYY